MSSEQLDGIWKCLCRSGSRSQPRQGPKPGRTAQPRGQHVPQGQKLDRKRRWRGFPGAPSGAGRGVSPRIPRIGAELGAWSRPRPAEGVRGRRERGDMFGRGSYTIVRRCKSSIFFVAIRSEIEVSASSQTRRCSLEVPLDVACCRYSVHWREGGSARRCASRNDVPRPGEKGEKMGGGDGVTGNGAPFPAVHLFPFPHPAAHVIPPPTIGGGGIPSSPVGAAAVANSPPMTDV